MIVVKTEMGFKIIDHEGMAESAALLVDEVFPDGVYVEDAYGKQRFHRVKAPTYSELNTLVHTLSYRIARCLEKQY